MGQSPKSDAKIADGRQLPRVYPRFWRRDPRGRLAEHSMLLYMFFLATCGMWALLNGFKEKDTGSPDGMLNLGSGIDTISMRLKDATYSIPKWYFCRQGTTPYNQLHHTLSLWIEISETNKIVSFFI